MKIPLIILFCLLGLIIMAHDHESVEYDLGDVKELYDACVLIGTIIEIDYANDKADVEISGLGRINDVSIFYHCKEEITTVGGSGAFEESDEVYVLNKEGRLNPMAVDLKIVGLVNGLRDCCYINEQFDDDLSSWTIDAYGDLEYSLVAEELWVRGTIGPAPGGASSRGKMVHIKKNISIESILRFLTRGTASAGTTDDQSKAWVALYYTEAGIPKVVEWHFLRDKVYSYPSGKYWVGTGAKELTLLDYLPANAMDIELRLYFWIHVASATVGSASLDAYVDYVTLCYS